MAQHVGREARPGNDCRRKTRAYESVATSKDCACARGAPNKDCASMPLHSEFHCGTPSLAFRHPARIQLHFLLCGWKPRWGRVAERWGEDNLPDAWREHLKCSAGIVPAHTLSGRTLDHKRLHVQRLRCLRVRAQDSRQLTDTAAGEQSAHPLHKSPASPQITPSFSRKSEPNSKQ